VFDSPVILEYLDARHGGNVLIPQGPDRIRVLQQQALADGILDAAILVVYESRFRDQSIHSQVWLDHQRGKIDRALGYAEQVYAVAPAGAANAGSISLAVALGYLDFRFDGSWRQAHPKLAGWLDAFSQANPAYAATAP
jgi:glutathione S-transferase